MKQAEFDRIVVFHIGKGGRFNSQGHKSLRSDLHSFADCISDCSELNIIETDDDGNSLPEDEWQLTDWNGDVLLVGKEEIFAETGTLDLDGDYDTLVAKRLEDCDTEELELVVEAYKDGDCDITKDMYLYCLDALGLEEEKEEEE